MELQDELMVIINRYPDMMQGIEAIRAALHDLCEQNSEPVDFVRWVPIELVQPNDYNPNAVAPIELGLLKTSIDHDGYTQPVVTIYDDSIGKYVIVDGFHRYYVLKSSPELQARTHGLLPIVVLKKSIADRMASTVRHNRARGKHSLGGMSNLVFKLLDEGMSDDEVCRELGMEPEELLRLKHVTGFSKLFEDAEYQRAWVTKNQIRIHLKAQEKYDNPAPY